MTRGSVFHSEHQVLVIANPDAGAILLLDPATGSTLQSLSSDPWGFLWDVRVNKDQMFFLHGIDEQLYISQVELVHPEKGV